MGPRSTLPPPFVTPNLAQSPPLGHISRRFFDLPAGRRGVGILVSGIGDLILSNIWRNEYYLADLSLQVHSYLPREYFKKKVQKDRTNISGVLALVPPQLSDSSLCGAWRGGGLVCWRIGLATVMFTPSESNYRSVPCNYIFRIRPSPLQISLKKKNSDRLPSAPIPPSSSSLIKKLYSYLLIQLFFSTSYLINV